MPTCVKCQKTKPTRSFRQISRKPAKYTPACLACVTKDESNETALQLKEIKDQRDIKKVTRDLHKRKIKARAKTKRASEKKYRADLELKKEYALRILAKRRLLQYIKRFFPDYQAGWVHTDICERLERFMKAVADGESPRLLLFMPPRHGKSEIASNYFPSWALGHHPEFEIIAASYAVSLPLGFSRKIRARLKDPMYQAMFPKTILDPENTAAEGWSTTLGGGYVPAGVGGGITGKGAHIAIFDDPVKDAEEADSETSREKTWDWYGSTFKSRLAPGGGILGIQTRWHDADLSGKLIEQQKELTKEYAEQLLAERNTVERATEEGDELAVATAQARIDELEEEFIEIDAWEIVEYPALATKEEWLNDKGSVVTWEEYVAERGVETAKRSRAIAKKTGSLISGGERTRLVRWMGEALHPPRFPRGRLLNMKRSMQPRHWSALYQQNPVPDEGAYFTKSMLRTTVYIPVQQEMAMYAAWDLAIGTKQVNDYVVGAVGGLDYDDQLHVVDIIRGKWGDPASMAKVILDTHVKYGCQKTGMERGQLYLAVMPQLIKDIRKRRIAVTFDEDLVPITDKAVRARPLQGRMQQGMVDFIANQPWMEDVVHELLRFPGGVNDDIVDALSWLVRMVMKQQPPRRPTAKQIKSWRSKLVAHLGGAKNHMAS